MRTLSTALLCLTRAQYSDTAQSQDTGYGNGGSDTYEENPIHHDYRQWRSSYYQHSHRIKGCVVSCPPVAPCYSKTSGQCVGFEAYVEPTQTYAAPQQQAYGAQQQTYADQGAQQTSYRKLRSRTDSCPVDTIDTSGNVVGSTGRLVLWIGFGIFFLAAAYYMCMFYHFHFLNELEDEWALENRAQTELSQFLAAPTLHASLVCLVASLAYLTMASGIGFYTNCVTGRQMYYVRYIDWLITTPMMLLALCHFGNARTVLTNYLISMDILMILSGLIGATIDGGEKWVFFGVAMLFFLPVIYYLLVLYSQILDNRVYDFFGEWLVADGSMPTKGKTGLTRGVLLPYLFYFPNYRTLAALTIVLWFLYPVMWILTEGTSVLSSDFEAIGYTVIDVLAKVVFGFVIVQSRRYRLHDMPAGVTFMLGDDEVAMVLSSPASGGSFL